MPYNSSMCAWMSRVLSLPAFLWGKQAAYSGRHPRRRASGWQLCLRIRIRGFRAGCLRFSSGQRGRPTASDSSHPTLVRDHVKRLKRWAGLDEFNLAEPVAEKFFKMFLLHFAACSKHHFTQVKVGTEWPVVTTVDFRGFIDADNAPVFGFVLPVLELGSE